MVIQDYATMIIIPTGTCAKDGTLTTVTNLKPGSFTTISMELLSLRDDFTHLTTSPSDQEQDDFYFLKANNKVLYLSLKHRSQRASEAFGFPSGQQVTE